ncbi:MAG: NADH-quinone oxidoreductase subunit J [Candidatus Jidaibacter sp.]|nr:NADH-quinone oxidoreductase subunit J [Candidatus Jidaibacter sp.]
MIELLFYLFSITLVISSLLVVSLRNPVHAVLFLIFAFFNAAGIFIMLGAEFIAMTLIIVYVGAVAVLFLFVVMMLNVNVAELKQGFLRTMPLGVLVGTLIFLQLMIALSYSSSFFPNIQAPTDLDELTNTEQIGLVLYTDYFIPFQLAGLVLLVAMIGAIVLTLTHNKATRRQIIADQVQRTKDSVQLKDVKLREGVKL